MIYSPKPVIYSPKPVFYSPKPVFYSPEPVIYSLKLYTNLSNRHGPRFQIRYGVNVGEFDSSQTMGAINNGSLLFRTSNRTAYLLGGRPQEAQVKLCNITIVYC